MSKREDVITNYRAAAYDFSQLVISAEKETILNLTETKEYKKLLKSFEGLDELNIKVSDLKSKF